MTKIKINFTSGRALTLYDVKNWQLRGDFLSVTCDTELYFYIPNTECIEVLEDD